MISLDFLKMTGPSILTAMDCPRAIIRTSRRNKRQPTDKQEAAGDKLEECSADFLAHATIAGQPHSTSYSGQDQSFHAPARILSAL